MNKRLAVKFVVILVLLFAWNLRPVKAWGPCDPYSPGHLASCFGSEFDSGVCLPVCEDFCGGGVNVAQYIGDKCVCQCSNSSDDYFVDSPPCCMWWEY